MSIPWLVIGDLQKLGLKLDKQKVELQELKNGVGERVEKKLQTTLGQIRPMLEIKLFNTSLGEYGVELPSIRRLVVNLSQRTCSSKQW